MDGTYAKPTPIHISDRQLNEMINAVAARLPGNTKPVDDLSIRHPDVLRAADLLLRFCGNTALERARALETSPTASPFARWVRECIESRAAGINATA